jgi:hypothetical protein
MSLIVVLDIELDQRLIPENVKRSLVASFAITESVAPAPVKLSEAPLKAKVRGRSAAALALKLQFQHMAYRVSQN